jgi:DNA-binding beta-propeller fold protein YncE/mono/diheme cytochrome c family protein
MRTLRPLCAVLAASALAAAAAACGGAASPPVAPVAHAPDARGCGRILDASRSPVPVELTRTGSSVAIARLGGKTYAYIADEDDSAVHVVDVDARKDVSKTPVAGKPAQLLFLADGRLVVTLRDQAQVEVLEPGPDATKPMDPRCSVGTEAEPYGVAVTPDDSAIVVTSAWGKSLTSYDAKSPTLARQWEVALPREPRGIVVSDDGARAFVAQAVGGQLSVVDLKLRQVIPTATHLTDENLKAASKAGTLPDTLSNLRFSAFGGNGKGSSCQGFALAKTGSPGGRVLIPQALVDPGDPSENPSGYGSSRQDQAEVGDIAVIDESNGDLFVASLQTTPANLARSMQSSSSGHDHQECLLPRSAAYDVKRKALLVGCFGIDDVVSYDALAASPARAVRRRWDVAAGPTGIAVDSDRDRAVVFSQFERIVNVISLAGSDLVDDKGPDQPPPVAHFALSEPTHGLAVNLALGRVLFNMVGDERISHDGRACASCHPDGRDDSLTWATPNGPRRSIMLAGRVQETAPFSWSGTEQTLKEHMGITFNRLKGSGDLRSMEMDALADYVQTLAPPPVSATTTEMAARVARGSEIFHSAAAACSSCHAGAYATDNDRHDVESKTGADKNGTFNTPSLRFVGGGGPYFHDGRYKTLRQLLTDADRKMGHTAQLSNDDLEALEAYLRSI